MPGPPDAAACTAPARVTPAAMPAWAAVKYVLRIRTSVVIIIASSLVYLVLGGGALVAPAQDAGEGGRR